MLVGGVKFTAKVVRKFRDIHDWMGTRKVAIIMHSEGISAVQALHILGIPTNLKPV